MLRNIFCPLERWHKCHWQQHLICGISQLPLQRGVQEVLFNPTQFWSCLYEMFCSHLQSLPLLPLSSGQAQIGRTFVFVFSGCSFLLSDVLQGGHLILPLYLAVSLNSSLLSDTERFGFPWFPGAWCALCSSKGVRTTSVKVIVSSYYKLGESTENPVAGHYLRLAQTLGAAEIALPSKWMLLGVVECLLHFSWICKAFLAP